MQTFTANGKLLITAEYFVLDGASALAIPVRYNQKLSIQPLENKLNTNPCLFFNGYDYKQQLWFSATFDIANNLTLLNNTCGDATMLFNLLQKIKKINPLFLCNQQQSIQANTYLNFNNNWGLGSSSTLVSLLAQWTNINPFQLLFQTTGGSGYDIACASQNMPIIYQKINEKPIYNTVNFNPTFSQQLYFVHLGIKQNSRKAIDYFNNQKKQANYAYHLNKISEITQQISTCNSLSTFQNLLLQHEQIISTYLNSPTAYSQYFNDYTFGIIKSLGAWGGDFVLATSNQSSYQTIQYFYKKGYTTVIPYQNMVL